jgi:YidC/Oxa1 family membrane protein insertase
MGATLLARVLLLPAFIKSQKAMAKMQELKPQTDKMAEAKKAYAKVGDKMGEQREAQKVMLLYKERGVNPFSAIGWGFLPAVVLISFFFAIRGIVDANVPGLGTQGVLWVKDLTMTDETYIMPALSTLGFLGAYKAGLKTQTAPPNEMISKLIIPLSAVGLIASSWFPSVSHPVYTSFCQH